LLGETLGDRLEGNPVDGVMQVDCEDDQFVLLFLLFEATFRLLFGWTMKEIVC